MRTLDISATVQPTAAELRTLVFIKQSLLTFRQTFTSQIAVFSNKMLALTDATISVSLISSTGEIALVSVPVTAGS